MPQATETYTLKGTKFVVPAYYKVTKTLGHGAYGVVAEALDTRTNQTVAIKKISNLFVHLVDAKRTLREVSILRYLSHENIVKLVDVLVPESCDSFEEIYVVFDHMQTDMFKVIGSTQQLSIDHIQYFIYQLLRGLKYLHSAGVIHRDLKPSNLLLNGDCALEICDLGLARLVADSPAKGSPDSQDAQMTEYVATRWYRAPEIILGYPNYGKPVDLFSVGCIFAELLLRKPLFPGKDYIHQLHLILELLGTPSRELLERIASESARNYVLGLRPFEPVPLSRKFPMLSPSALNLLEGLLAFDPDARLTVDQALNHPFFEGLHDPTDEPDYTGKEIRLFFENYELTRPLLELSFLNEVRKFHDEEARAEVAKRAEALGIPKAEWDY